jgi:hypothetical protein
MAANQKQSATSFKYEAECTFPYCFDIRVPESSGQYIERP